MKNMELPIETQIEVLKSVKNKLLIIENYYAELDDGLCRFLSRELLYIIYGHRYISFAEIQLYIPLFTYKNAVKYSNANQDEMYYWWNIYDKNSRIKFLDWMISELEKEGNKK